MSTYTAQTSGHLALFLSSKKRKEKTEKRRQVKAWMGSEREGDEKKGNKGGLIVHPGERDNIRCLKAATTNPVISWTRIMKMVK